MLRFLPWPEILVGVLLWLAIRGGTRAADEAPELQRATARFLVLVGVLLTAAPVGTLLADLVTVRAAGEITTTILFSVVFLLWMSPAWLWLARLIRKRTGSQAIVVTRSATSLVIVASLACWLVAIRHYSAFLIGAAEGQSGIVIFLVPLQQLVITAVLAASRRLIEGQRTRLPAQARVGSRAA